MTLRNSITLLGLAVFASAACTQPRPADQFTIRGTVNGVDSGAVVLRSYNHEDRTSTTIDSVPVKDGRFELTGKLDGPRHLDLNVTPGNWGASLFAENADIELSLDTAGAEHYDWSRHGGVKGARLVNYSVKGSESHAQLEQYQKHPEELRFAAFFKNLNKGYDSASEDERAALKLQSDSMRQLRDAWERHWLDSFITATPASPVGAYLFHNYYMFHEDMEIAEMERILNKFEGDAKASPYYTLLSKNYEQKLALSPGQIAPDFTALRPDSTEFTLSSTRGNYVLLDFWASWCVPCRKSIPHWKEVYSNYKDKGFEIVAVTNDARWSDWKKALEEENMPWIQVADEFPVKNMPARIGTLYMTPFLPSYTLLDPEGKILIHNGSKEEITAELEKRLGGEA